MMLDRLSALFMLYISVMCVTTVVLSNFCALKQTYAEPADGILRWTLPIESFVSSFLFNDGKLFKNDDWFSCLNRRDL